MDWLQSKYISLLSSQLLRFKQKSNELYNFRCCFCGDSATSKNRARAYLIGDTKGVHFYCHNCHETYHFDEFLNRVNPSLFKQYLFEKLNSKTKKRFTETKAKIVSDDVSIGLPVITALPADHYVRKYIRERKIPEKYRTDLFYAEKFKSWVNTVVPGKFEDEDLDEERIVIPFRSPNKKLIGFQGRTLKRVSAAKYITIMVDSDAPKVFNWDRADLNRQFYVVEGPFDCMFLDNAIATAGGKITSEIAKLPCEMSNVTVLYDNEPRNRDVVANLKKAIDLGYKVVIWPEKNRFKDINDMVKAGTSIGEIRKMLAINVFSGLQAHLKLGLWKKV